MHNSIYLETRAKWREWLKKNHNREPGIWLIYNKKHTGKPSIPYNDAVEEALCFGWIDSTVKKMDEERYMQQFTPRNFKSSWSPSNVERVEKLIRQKKMTRKGLDLYLYAKEHDMLPDPEERSNRSLPDLPPYFKEALEKDPAAKKSFDKLTDAKKRYYLVWIMAAKKEETLRKRVKEAIALLRKGRELGMK